MRGEPTGPIFDLMTPQAEQMCADVLASYPPNGYVDVFTAPPLLGLFAALRAATSPEARESAITHWLEITGHSAAQRGKILRRIGQRPPGAHLNASAQDRFGFEAQDAADLMRQQLPPLKQIVDQFIYEGSLIVAGSPKTGKSYMMLGIALAVVYGGKALGKFDCCQGEVLYFALEDGQRRIQRRLAKMLQGAPMPAGLHLVYQARKLDDGFMEGLDAYLEEHPAISLVVVDTLAKIRPPGNNQSGIYQQDYDTIDPFTQLSHARGLCASLITHTGKQQRDDPMAMVSGTQGLTGAADAAIVVSRERGTPELHCTVMGRDYDDEVEHILRWDAQIAGLSHQGSAVDLAKNRERMDVLTAIDELGGAGSIQAISTACSKSYNTTKTMLWRMGQDGLVEKDREGKYRKCCNLVTSVTSPLVVDNKTVTLAVTEDDIRLQEQFPNVTAIRQVTAGNNLPVTGVHLPSPERNTPQVTAGYKVTAISPVGFGPAGQDRF